MTAHAQPGTQGDLQAAAPALPWVPTYRSCWLGAWGCRGAWLRLPCWLAGSRGRGPGSWLALLLQPSLGWGLLGVLWPVTLLLQLLLRRLCVQLA